jgi:hypothetical protein
MYQHRSTFSLNTSWTNNPKSYQPRHTWVCRRGHTSLQQNQNTLCNIKRTWFHQLLTINFGGTAFIIWVLPAMNPSHGSLIWARLGSRWGDPEEGDERRGDASGGGAQEGRGTEGRHLWAATLWRVRAWEEERGEREDDRGKGIEVRP